jgi:chromosomal replication initiator protein
MTTVSTLERDISRFSRAQNRLQALLGTDVYENFFRRLTLEGVDKGIAHMSVPTAFLKHWITTRYREHVMTCMQAENIEVQSIDITVRPLDAHPFQPVTVAAEVVPLVPKQPLVSRSNTTASTDTHDGLGGSPLTPQFTFETLVTGRSNKLAITAAREVASALPGDVRMFNPLYLHSESGRGKTHITQAICWETRSQRVLYLTVEKFMLEFVRAVRSRSVIEYKIALRNIDTLILDDVQLLRGQSVQSEFHYACKALISAGHQIVVTADRSPHDLEGFDPLLMSQFEGGLVIEIGAHDESMREAILAEKLRGVQVFQPGFSLPDGALPYLAQTLIEGGHSLEVVFQKLRARYALWGNVLTMDNVFAEAQAFVQTRPPKRPKIEEVQRVVARHYNVARSDMVSSDRTKKICLPRQVAMYLCKVLSLRSLPEIGRRFGGRDHTTVLHGIRKIEKLMARDPAFVDEISMLTKVLTGQ